MLAVAVLTMLAPGTCAVNLLDIAPAAACILGVEWAVAQYIRIQVAEGVRLRSGEPRYVDWKVETELEEMMAVACGPSNTVPLSNLKVRSSGVKGMGLFTTAPIESGTHILQYTGRTVAGDMHNSLASNGEYAISACSAAGDPFYIDAADPSSGLGRYMNHAAIGERACNAACIRGAYSQAARREPPPLHVFARRDIEAGEELQWDYGSDYWAKRGGDPGRQSEQA